MKWLILIVSLSILAACANSRSANIEDVSLGKPANVKDWIEVTNAKIENIDNIVILDFGKGGAIEVTSDSISGRNGKIYVRNGSNVISRRAPSHTSYKTIMQLNSVTEDCDNAIPAPASEVCITRWRNPTTCYGVVMVCHECCYYSNGIFKGTSSGVCGVCVGFPF